MRKGVKARPWTVADVRYLMENAGHISKREICLYLKRSSVAVDQKAKALRKDGKALSLRCYKPRLAPCPACGALSGHLGREGICEPCRRREQLAEINARIAELMPLLPQEERDLYEKTEAQTDVSRRDPMPKAPDTRDMSYYHRAKAEEAYVLAMEKWAAKNLQREIKRVQKRKERIEEKTKINDSF